MNVSVNGCLCLSVLALQQTSDLSWVYPTKTAPYNPELDKEKGIDGWTKSRLWFGFNLLKLEGLHYHGLNNN